MLQDRNQIVPVQAAQIPAELKELHRWVGWKAEKRDDDLAKVPYQGQSPFVRASSTNSATWTTFATCLERYEQRAETGFDGLMIALGDGLAGIRPGRRHRPGHEPAATVGPGNHRPHELLHRA